MVDSLTPSSLKSIDWCMKDVEMRIRVVNRTDSRVEWRFAIT